MPAFDLVRLRNRPTLLVLMAGTALLMAIVAYVAISAWVGGHDPRALPPGADLPSGAECAAQVVPAEEVRQANIPYNNTRGTDSHDSLPRVDGDFVGTTDEILQWAACKWGIDTDIVRAQAVVESWWDMENEGDFSSDQSLCHPELQTAEGECPESIGLLQIKFEFHSEAYEDENAIRSTAYNADYAYARWRECYDGDLEWLNTVERGKEYDAGDLEGCLGVWFAGRWYTDLATGYIEKVLTAQTERTWEHPDFLGFG